MRLLSAIFLFSILVLGCEKDKSLKDRFTFEEIKITREDLLDISFLNEQYGIILGANNVFHLTKNSAQTWTTISSDIEDPTRKVQFVNCTTILLAGYGLYSSNDLGKNWETLIPREIGSRISDFYFFNADTGIILRFGIQKTFNGGNDWNLILDNDDYYNCNMSPLEKISFCRDLRTGIVTGGSTHDGGSCGFMYITNNYGETWDPSNIKLDDITNHYLFEDKSILVFTAYRNIYKISNLTDTLELISTDYPCMYPKVAFLNDSEGFMACYGDIYFTDDFGQQWEKLYSTNKTISEIITINSSRAICICKDGNIIQINRID